MPGRHLQSVRGVKKDSVKPSIDNVSSILGVAQENFPIYQKYSYPLLIQQGLEDTTVVPGVNIAAGAPLPARLQRETSDVPGGCPPRCSTPGNPDTIAWLNDRFAGVPAQSDCGGM